MSKLRYGLAFVGGTLTGALAYRHVTARVRSLLTPEGVDIEEVFERAERLSEASEEDGPERPSTLFDPPEFDGEEPEEPPCCREHRLDNEPESIPGFEDLFVDDDEEESETVGLDGLFDDGIDEVISELAEDLEVRDVLETHLQLWGPLTKEEVIESFAYWEEQEVEETLLELLEEGIIVEEDGEYDVE